MFHEGICILFLSLTFRNFSLQDLSVTFCVILSDVSYTLTITYFGNTVLTTQ
jgi:hypothetical protein